MQITLSVPEQYLLAESASELGKRVALYAALLMFRSGEVSAGAAAEFAGIDRFTFALECQRHQIPVVDYDPTDLRAEFDALRRAS
jgi:predicted HTH domain antitoxin